MEFLSLVLFGTIIYLALVVLPNVWDKIVPNN